MGSKRNFYYKAGDGLFYTTPQINEANTEAVNAGDTNVGKIPQSTYDNFPSGLRMRYVRMYQVDNPIVKRTVFILNPATLSSINVNTDFSLPTLAGAKNFRIAEFVGERRKLAAIADTGQTDGDSEAVAAPV